MLDFDYVHFLEEEAHNFDRLVDHLPWTIFTGCPKKRTFRILKAFHCQLSKATYSQTWFRKRAIQRVRFLGHPLALSNTQFAIGRGRALLIQSG